jgi:arylsulfatase A-like enzyme
MPLVARWPGRVAAGATSAALVSLTDVLATVAALVGVDAGRSDGVDFSPALFGRAWTRPAEAPLVAQSSTGHNVIRSGSWKLIDRLGSGGFSDPRTMAPTADAPSVQLYDLASDPAEQQNLAAEQPERAAALQRELKKILTSADPGETRGTP